MCMCVCVCIYSIYIHTHCRSKDFFFFNVIYFSDANHNYNQPFMPVFSVTQSFRNLSSMLIYYQCCSF